MRVSELIDILKDQDPDAEVELAVVAPLEDGDDDITVDRYTVDGVLPWHDEESDGGGELVIWLIGGEEADVEAFLDVVEEATGNAGHDDGDDDHAELDRG